MLEKSRHAVFFQWFVVSWCSKSRLATAAGAGVAAQQRKSKIARRCGEKPIYKWKYIKKPQVRSTFCTCDVEKSHAAVARSTFTSQNVQSRSASERFWSSDAQKLHAAVARSAFTSQNVKKWRCRTTFWTSDVEKLQVKMLKKMRVRERFLKVRCGKLHAAVARSTCVCENVENTSAADSILKFWCPNNARGCGEKHIYKSKCTKNTAQSHHFLKFWCGCCESITCVSASQPASQPPSQPASQGNWSVDPLVKQSINQSASLWLATTNLSYRFPILKLLVSLFTSTVHIFTTESKGFGPW